MNISTHTTPTPVQHDRKGEATSRAAATSAPASPPAPEDHGATPPSDGYPAAHHDQAPPPEPASPPARLSVLNRLRRPRLLPGLPVLYRAPGEFQVGIEPRHAAVVSDIAEPLAKLLRTIDGRDTAEELAARAGPITPALDHLLTGLAKLHLVEDAVPSQLGIDGTPAGGIPARLAVDCSWWSLRTGQARDDANTRRQRAVVVIHGGGRVASSLATLLAAAGVGWVQVVAEGAVAPEEVGCGYLPEDVGRPRSEALRCAVRRSSPETNTAPVPRQRKPDLVVFADTEVHDPQLAKELYVNGTVQLLVSAGEGTAVVGPLIVPGRSCCPRCVDLHKTDIEPAWPTLAPQLAARRTPTDVISAQACAAFAVSQVLRTLDGPRIGGLPWQGISALPVWNSSVEIDPFSGETRRQSWPPHPACPCGQQETADQAGHGADRASQRGED